MLCDGRRRSNNLHENTGLSITIQAIFQHCRRTGGASPHYSIKEREQEKTPLGTVWDAPAGLKEAIQLPAQHRSLQLPGLRGGKTERRQNSQRIAVRRPRCSEAKLTIQTYVKLT